MSLLKSRLIYDMNHFLLYEDDEYLSNFNIKEELETYHHIPFTIILRYEINNADKSFSECLNVISKNCHWLFDQFYTTEQVEIIIKAIMCRSFDITELWANKNYFEDILHINISDTTIKEIIFCLYEIKKRLLECYMLYDADNSIIETLFNELLPLSSNYEHFTDSINNIVRKDLLNSMETEDEVE